MPPRQVTVQSITLGEVRSTQIGTSYDVAVEYNILFNDGTGQARLAQRTVSSGSVKAALDVLYADIKTRIENLEGVPVT